MLRILAAIHGVSHAAGRGRAEGDEVVAEDAGAGRDPADADVVVTGGDEAGNGCPVGLEGVEDAAPASVVVVPRGQDVGGQVLVAGLETVIDHHDVDPLPHVATGPDALDVDVLHGPTLELARVAEVPLAPVPGIALGGRQTCTGLDHAAVGRGKHAEQIRPGTAA